MFVSPDRRWVSIRKERTDASGRPLPRGRGAARDLRNRFREIHVELDPDAQPTGPPTTYLEDSSRQILVRNDSPDVGFDVGINPYRGCEHGCAYCYARPTHEYLGFSAGLDFESRIVVKRDAAKLLEQELARPRYEPTPIAFSGVTDAWQPVERKLGITRACLEVLAACAHPVGAVTKSHLVTRDVDLFAKIARAVESAERGATGARVAISITTLDVRLARALEPRASSPTSRLDALRVLRDAGVSTHVMVAPVIPALTDHEIPSILAAAREAGAQTASYVLLRLPHGVKDVFRDWLTATVPDRAEKVLSRIRSLRGGGLDSAAFGERMRGSGPFAAQLRQLFQTMRARCGYAEHAIPLSSAAFRPPAVGQLRLF